MPKGMRLKSEGFASSLSDPGSTFTLGSYCEQKGIPYADIGFPVPLETFIDYGLEFQARFVPGLENKAVVSLQPSSTGFRIRLGDGEVLEARRVVVAVGLSYFAYVPPVLSALPEELVSHSSRHSTLDHFKGREVAVVGAGASAVDLAALLHQAGARVEIVARKPAIRFHDPPDNLSPSLMERLRTPITGIGPGWKLFWCTNAPLLFRWMPEKFRFEKVRQILGPAPGWFIKQDVVGKVPFNLGVTIAGAKVQDGRVSLELIDRDGTRRALAIDHVVAATGYKVDLRRLTFMDSGMLTRIRSVEQTPVLSSNFECSLPGLYFVGTSAANTFGPLLRFAFGARFTAHRLSRHLARSSRNSVPGKSVRNRIEAPDRNEVCSR
jgi:thioredoxin reductase